MAKATERRHRRNCRTACFGCVLVAALAGVVATLAIAIVVRSVRVSVEDVSQTLYVRELPKPDSGEEWYHWTVATEQPVVWEVLGTLDFGGVGISLTVVGDLDGDGWEDLAVGVSPPARLVHPMGAMFEQPRSRVLILSGVDGEPLARLALSAEDDLAGGGGRGEALVQRLAFGASVAHLGDLDGDATDELAIAAPEASVLSWFKGALPGWIPRSLLRQLTVSRLFVVSGTEYRELFSVDLKGAHLAFPYALGDLDANGEMDWAVACTFLDTEGRQVPLRCELWSFESVEDRPSRKTNFGAPITRVAVLGDIDGDEVADLLIQLGTLDKEDLADIVAWSWAHGREIYRVSLASNGEFAAIDDLNDDGVREFAVCTQQNGGLRIELRSGRDGSTLRKISHDLDAPFTRTTLITLPDADGDGRYELVVATRTGAFIVWSDTWTTTTVPGGSRTANRAWYPGVRSMVGVLGPQGELRLVSGFPLEDGSAMGGGLVRATNIAPPR